MTTLHEVRSPAARGPRRGRRSRDGTARVAGLASACLALACLLPALASGAPYIWDQDEDRLDDRVETVHLLGYDYSFEQADTLKRQRIVVAREAGDLVFGLYVVFEQEPTESDLAALAALGLAVLHRYEAVPALRTVGTHAQAQAAADLSGVERVEAIPLMHPMVWDGAASVGVRDLSERAFPTWAGEGGPSGDGVVIAFLDSGINDAAEGIYPGHESLAGRFLGGATFVLGDSALDTPRNGSMNPVDRGGPLTRSHGTHVAGIALGTGGPSGYARGVAPSARFVDVKVLSDAGVGSGLAEALDWCVHNRARDWGVPGYEGIDIVNLSLSGIDRSDGNDVTARIARRAAELGMILCASMGNDGLDGFVPSPAAGDLVLAVGAGDPQRTAVQADDLYPAFNNAGPRADDGDGDPGDELKPDLLAPGVSVLSADGDLTTDGAQYRRLSGTSMAAAFVSGIAALIKSANPGMSATEIAEVLRATAWRDVSGLRPGPPGPDPRWQASRGYGVVDVWAARLEIVQPLRSQVVRFELQATGDRITSVVRTQRERGASHFVVERAEDAGGSPGAFAPYDSAAASGGPSLADSVNRRAYAFDWAVPAEERGRPFWYRVSFTESGVRHDGPERRFESPLGPSAATLEITIVHNAYDNDIRGSITAVDRTASSLESSGAPPELRFELPGSSAAVASEWVNGSSMTGNVAWTFRIEVPEGASAAFLPPDHDHPWWLRVEEGGFLNRSGQLTDYRLVWHGPGGDVEYAGGLVPQKTVEGGSVIAVIPITFVGVPSIAESAPALRVGPSPVEAGGEVRFVRPSPEGGELRLHDVSGRLVGHVTFQPSGDVSTAVWTARDRGGRPLPSGVYFGRASWGATTRVLVVER